MRQLEAKLIEERRALMKEQHEKEDLEQFESTIAPVMAQAQSILQGTDPATATQVSTKGLEGLARWKLDI